MNEKKEMLYEISEAVRNLNKVEGFNPKDYLRKEETEEGISFYLDTKYRLLWYRLLYPNGKIIKIPKTLNKDYATFEVRIYADKKDELDNFLANGFASRYKNEDDIKFGLNFVEVAETAALGRALNVAGFGTQFCDVAIANDPSVVDAGVNLTFGDLDEEIPDPDQDGVPEGVTGAKAKSDEVRALSREEKAENVETTEKAPQVKVEEKLELDSKMPYEELIKKMTVEYAKGIMVNYGYDAGKTLGYLALNKPNSIKFHAERSTDNLVKAGAQCLLNEAAQIA